MKLARGQLFHPPGVRELQRMLRTDGESPNVQAIETLGTGTMVTMHDGARWLINAAGYWLVDPSEVISSGPPPMPGNSTPRKAKT